MINRRVMIMAASALSCVLGLGLFMQQGVPMRQGSVADDQATAVDSADLILNEITLTSTARLKSPDNGARSLRSAMSAAVDANCTVSVGAAAAPQASVDLTFMAPCNGNERVTVHHFGLMFSAKTDDDGMVMLRIPALAENAVFIVELASGQGAVATARVVGLDQIDRVALQWSGNSGFEIHAREFGAEYGQPGHVWSGADPVGRSSQVVRLGDDSLLAPRLAEIYSFARDAALKSRTVSGTVALSIEAEVSALNCGREISAQSLELRDGQRLRMRDVVMSMPNCNAIGDFLVLNNLVEDLKIAIN